MVVLTCFLDPLQYEINYNNYNHNYSYNYNHNTVRLCIWVEPKENTKCKVEVSFMPECNFRSYWNEVKTFSVLSNSVFAFHCKQISVSTSKILWTAKKGSVVDLWPASVEQYSRISWRPMTFPMFRRKSLLYFRVLGRSQNTVRLSCRGHSLRKKWSSIVVGWMS